MRPLHQFQHIYNPYTKNVDDSQPSLHEEPRITDSVKPIDKKLADIEAEKDELILKPDLSGIYKVMGKRHGKGGTPIKAEPGSFIYSDYKTLAITQKEKELMKLKEGGSTDRQKNTPAEVVKKNVDIEHYNRLVNNLQDDDKDVIAKRSSTLMLSKYQEILGRIAYLQEEKKRFKQGLPAFAEGSAPLENPEMEQQIEEQEQYRAGGVVNPYLPKAQMGMYNAARYAAANRGNPAVQTASVPPAGFETWKGDKLPTFQDRYGVTNAADKITDLAALAKELGYQGPMDIKKFQEWLYASSPENKAVIDKWHDNYNEGPIGGMFDGKVGIRWANALREIQRKPTPPKITITAPPTEQWTAPVPAPQPTNPQGTYLPYEPNVKKTLPMLEGEMFAGLDAASVKKYNPYRQQVKSQLTEFARYNPQNAINRITQSTNQAYNATRGLNPYQAQATIQEVYSKGVEGVARAQGDYDERNVGVENMQNQANAQTQNKDLGDNITFDKRYYDEQTLSNQRFDNAKTMAWGQFRDLRNQNQEQLDSLYNVLAQQPIAGSKPVLDRKGKQVVDKNGQPVFQSMPLYDVVPGTIRTRYTGVGNILNANINNNPGDAYNDSVYRALVEKSLSGTITKEQAYHLAAIERARASRRGKGYKMGGFVNPYN